MSVPLKLKFNKRELNASIRELGTKRVATATRQALNRVGTTIRKEARKELSEQTDVRRKGTISKVVSVDKASKNRLKVVLTAKELYIPLEQVKGTKVSTTRRGKGKSKRKVQTVRFRGQRIKGAFRPTNFTKGGNAITVQTEGKYKTGNRKLKRLYAYSLLQEEDKHNVLDRMAPVSHRRFDIEFGRALANQLRIQQRSR